MDLTQRPPTGKDMRARILTQAVMQVMVFLTPLYLSLMVLEEHCPGLTKPTECRPPQL